MPLGDQFDPAIAEQLWASLPPECRREKFDKKTLPDQYRPFVRAESAGGPWTTVALNMSLPQTITWELAWLLHREIELGRTINPNRFNGMVRAMRAATGNGTRAGREAQSLLSLGVDQWEREVQAARLRGHTVLWRRRVLPFGPGRVVGGRTLAVALNGGRRGGPVGGEAGEAGQEVVVGGGCGAGGPGGPDRDGGASAGGAGGVGQAPGQDVAGLPAGAGAGGRPARGRADAAVRRDGFAPPYPDNWQAATDVVVDAEAEHVAEALYVLSPQMCDVVLAAAQPLIAEDLELLSEGDLPRRVLGADAETMRRSETGNT